MKFEDLKVGMWVVDAHGDRTQVVAIPDSPGEYVHGSVWSWCPLYNMDGVRPLTLGDLKPGERFSFVEFRGQEHGLYPVSVPCVRTDAIAMEPGCVSFDTLDGDMEWCAADPASTVSLVLDEGEAETCGHTYGPGDAVEWGPEDPDKAEDVAGAVVIKADTPEPPQPFRIWWHSTSSLQRCCKADCHGLARWSHYSDPLCTIHAVEAGMPDPYAEHRALLIKPSTRFAVEYGVSDIETSPRIPDFTHPRTIANRKPDIVLGIDWD